jgi:hypothetical protein
VATINFSSLLAQSPKIAFESILAAWNLNVPARTSTNPNRAPSDKELGLEKPYDSMIFKQYKSLEVAFEAIEEARNNTGTMTSGLPFSDATRFVNNPEYADFQSLINNFNLSSPDFQASKEVALSVSQATKSLINLAGSFKKEKIITTKDERGIFDFSLASQGLYRPIEYFSEDFAIYGGDEFANRKLPKGVIPPEKIDKKSNAFGTYYTYTDDNNKEYNCERRQIGTTNVFDFFKGETILKKNEQGITLPYYLNNQTKVFNGEGKNRLKYATQTKKVYLLFEKNPESTKYVDFFIPINAIDGVSDGTRIANALIPILVCLSLEEFNIKTRINSVRCGIDLNTYTIVSLPLKNYEERTIDKMDFILNFVGKQSSAKSIFAFFKVLNQNMGQVQPNGKMATARDESSLFKNLNYTNRLGMLDLFARYKNWIEVNKDADFAETKVKDKNFQVFSFQAIKPFSGLPFFQQRITSDASSFVENMPYIIFEYFFYIDYLSLQYLPMPQFMTILLKRFQEDENFTRIFTIDTTPSTLKTTIVSYVSSLLYSRYYVTAPTNAYADTPEQVALKDEGYANKIEEMKEAIKNYFA